MPQGGGERAEIVPWGCGRGRHGAFTAGRYVFRNWWSGERIGSWAACGPGPALERAVTEDVCLRGIDLRGVCLEEVDLGGAELAFANLRGARLRGARLTGARLMGANLAASDLSGASLSGAVLRGASLRGASLAGADFTGADLTALRLADSDEPLGDWKRFVEQDVPRLLTSGGRPLEEVAADEAWEARDWPGSPLERAFGVPEPAAIPETLRRLATCFQRLFTLRLIPQPLQKEGPLQAPKRQSRGLRGPGGTQGRRRSSPRGSATGNSAQMEQDR